jgi:hypothetical protein
MVQAWYAQLKLVDKETASACADEAPEQLPIRRRFIASGSDCPHGLGTSGASFIRGAFFMCWAEKQLAGVAPTLKIGSTPECQLRREPLHRPTSLPGSCGPALCCTGNPDRHLARPDDRIWGAVTKATSDELVTGAHSLLTPQ